MADTNTTNTPTPWEIISQDGSHLIVQRAADCSIRLIAHVLERKHSLAEDIANGELIVTAVNGWHSVEALRLRLSELEGGR